MLHSAAPRALRLSRASSPVPRRSLAAGIAWKGRNAPVPGTVHDLEFDVMPQLEIGTNASIVEGKEHSIRTDGNRNWLVGTIEAIDPDGMAHLRLAVDCLTMVEGNDNDVELGSQVKFTVEAKDLWIYPIGA